MTVLAGLVAVRLGGTLVSRAIDRGLRPGRAERQLAVIERKLARSADRTAVVAWPRDGATVAPADHPSRPPPWSLPSPRTLPW